MPLDANIILQGQMPQIQQPTDVMAKAMTMKDLSQRSQIQNLQLKQAQTEDQDQTAVRAAMAKNTVPGPNGMPTLNKQGVLAELINTAPQKAMALKKEFDAADLDNLTKQTAIQKDLAWSITDQASYDKARDTARKLNIEGVDKMPAQYDPAYVKHMQQASLSAKEKLDQHNKDREFDLKQQEVNTKKEENRIKRDGQQGEKVDKLAKDLRGDLDADRGRSGNFGQISAKVQSAERLEALVGAFKDGNLPPAQMEEMALGLAAMLAPGGGQSRAQVEALVPHTAMGDTQKFKSWLMNEPLGANQQKFVEMMTHTIGREKEVANDQLNGIRASRLSTHEELKKRNPQLFDKIVSSYGIDQSRVKNGKYVAAPTKDFDHLSDDQLDQLYKQAGGK